MSAVVLLLALVPIVIVDLRRRIIPDVIVLPATANILVQRRYRREARAVISALPVGAVPCRRRG